MEKTAFEKICDLSCYCDEPQHNTRLRGKIKQMCGNVQIFSSFFFIFLVQMAKNWRFFMGKTDEKENSTKKERRPNVASLLGYVVD